MSITDNEDAADVAAAAAAELAKDKREKERRDEIDRKFRQCHTQCMDKIKVRPIDASAIVAFLIAAGCEEEEVGAELMKKSVQHLNALYCHCRCGAKHPLPQPVEQIPAADADGTEQPKAVNEPPFAP